MRAETAKRHIDKINRLTRERSRRFLQPAVRLGAAAPLARCAARHQSRANGRSMLPPGSGPFPVGCQDFTWRQGADEPIGASTVRCRRQLRAPLAGLPRLRSAARRRPLRARLPAQPAPRPAPPLQHVVGRLFYPAASAKGGWLQPTWIKSWTYAKGAAARPAVYRKLRACPVTPLYKLLSQLNPPPPARRRLRHIRIFQRQGLEAASSQECDAGRAVGARCGLRPSSHDTCTALDRRQQALGHLLTRCCNLCLSRVRHQAASRIQRAAGRAAAGRAVCPRRLQPGRRRQPELVQVDGAPLEPRNAFLTGQRGKAAPKPRRCCHLRLSPPPGVHPCSHVCCDLASRGCVVAAVEHADGSQVSRARHALQLTF